MVRLWLPTRLAEAPTPIQVALRGCCPRCGGGPLFVGLLKMAPRCSACSLDYGRFNVGDGAAPFLIFIVATIIIIASQVTEAKLALARAQAALGVRVEVLCVHHADAAGATLARLEAGDVAVFFPTDVHMPGLRSGAAPVLVRKTVVKVPVA